MLPWGGGWAEAVCEGPTGVGIFDGWAWGVGRRGLGDGGWAWGVGRGGGGGDGQRLFVRVRRGLGIL